MTRNSRRIVFPPEPPVAVTFSPERRAAGKGAPFLRGGAYPCRRAPFWHLLQSRRAAEREHNPFVIPAGEL